MFYLKLQARFLLPASMIQTIIEDYQQMHDITQSHVLFRLKEGLDVIQCYLVHTQIIALSLVIQYNY